nr:hypothetical protein CFP56_30773 [Quercus suber]
MRMAIDGFSAISIWILQFSLLIELAVSAASLSPREIAFDKHYADALSPDTALPAASAERTARGPGSDPPFHAPGSFMGGKGVR